MSGTRVSEGPGALRGTTRASQATVNALLRQAVQHHQQGHLHLAEALYRQVLRAEPMHAEALHGLGVLASQQGNDALAATLVQRAIAGKAHVASFYNTLGNVRRKQGDVDAAIVAYRTALELQPTYATAHRNLGIVLREQGQLAAALQHLQTAVQYAPDVAVGHWQLGLAYYEHGSLSAAIPHLQAALRLQPECAEACYTLGNIYQQQSDLERARAYLERAVTYRPAWAEAYNNLGHVLYLQGQLTAALRSLDYALTLAPHYAPAQWNRALVWLAQGNLEQGWPAYTWRWQVHAACPDLPLPLWDGSPLSRRTVLVWAEQGVGDEIMFGSCLPELVAQAKHCVIVCDPRLVPLLARTFPTATVYGSKRHDFSWLAQLPPADVHIPLGSLPQYLRPTLHSFPSRAGYLVPNTTRQRQYQQRLATLGPGLKVGIAWRSLAARRHEPYYTTLAQWGPVLTVPGVHFVNLQYEEAEAELVMAEAAWGVSIHRLPDLDLWHDLDGVAALMAALDLIIGPQTAVTALAGSLGCAVWRLTPAAGTWDMLGTEHSPWFPSMRVVWQHPHGHWDEAFARLADELRKAAAGAEQRG